MRLGSLCTGYGGLDMGVAAHYATTPAWCSDNDPDCARVLDARLPGVPNLGDLTTVDWGQVEPVDIVSAGFPCQPVSLAGNRRRAGMDDERWIWDEIRVAVGILRPRIVVLENVAAVTLIGGARVVGDLATLGFDCRWGVVQASDAGAPHRRARWFCVAPHPDIEGPQGHGEDGLPEAGGQVDPAWGDYGAAIQRWEWVIGRAAPAPVTDDKLSSRFVEWMMGLPAGWVTDIGLSRAQELKILGNGVVPAQAKLALELLGV